MYEWCNCCCDDDAVVSNGDNDDDDDVADVADDILWYNFEWFQIVAKLAYKMILHTFFWRIQVELKQKINPKLIMKIMLLTYTKSALSLFIIIDRYVIICLPVRNKKKR